jgi:hypothetical protein
MRNGLDLAHGRGLQQAQAIARSLFGILVALPFEIDFQAGPLLRVHRTRVGSFELAVRRRLRHQQRRVGSVDSQFRILAWFNVSMDADGSYPDLTLNRNRFTLSRIARAAGEGHGAADNDRDGQNFWDE